MQELNAFLSNFIYQFDYSTLSSNVIKETKRFIVDYFAACFAGYKNNKSFNKIVREVICETHSYGACSVFLDKDGRYSTLDSAFMNALYCHGADMDDGNKKAMGHIGCHTISTAFSVGQEVHSSGKEIIEAIIIGYELFNRISSAVQPGLVRRGFHSTGTAGCIACAGVAAKLYKLNEEQIYNAISFAAVQSSGLIVITESGQACKPINPANAARIGIFSAKCAKKGLRAPKNIFESKRGWFHAMSDGVDLSFVFDGLGKGFTILESYIKPYPSCRHTHCGIEAAFRLKNELTKHRIDEQSIKCINVYIYKNAINVAGQVIQPTSEEESKFSIHFAVAYSLIHGHFTLSDLKNYNDELTQGLIKKIRLIEDSSMENIKNSVRGCKISVFLNDGRELSSTVLVPKGEAPNPITNEELIEKLMDCMDGVCDCSKAKSIIENVNAIDSIDSFCGINSFIL